MKNPNAALSTLLAEASREILGAPLQYSEQALSNILSPRHFVEVRKTLGGPAPEETARASSASRLELEKDENWWTTAAGALSAAEDRLKQRSAAL
jgi:argininosuccinate lyase